MSGICTSLSLGNLNDDHSDRESENESTTGKVDKKKRNTRPKRRKTLERSPRLTVLSYDEEKGEVECRLELCHKNTVTFKFATANDKPEEIAESLVSEELLPSQISIMVITLLREVIKMVKEDPKNAVSQCLGYVSTPSSSPETVRKNRLVFDPDTSKGINFEQLNITAAQQFQCNSQKSESMGPISAYSSMSGICTSLSLGNLNDDHSNRESENESTTGKVDEKKRKTRPKRRKNLERSPRLTVLSYDEENGEVECELEVYNKNTVKFKFATANDKPEEIAESLVSEELLPSQQSMMVITLLREVINMVKEDPKNAVSQRLSFVSTPSSSP